MNDADADYTALLLEQIRDQNRFVLEAVSGMQKQLEDMPNRSEFDELRQDARIIKAAVTDQSRQMSDHEHRIRRLEAA